MTNQHIARGGEFLLNQAAGQSFFVPEDFSLEQRQIAETTEAFVNNEIVPDFERMEDQDFPLVVEKLRRCAELGLFLVDVPEAFGGLELDKTTSLLVAEKFGPTGSFAVTYGGQTGIGSLPLIYYGTAEQKAKYLPRLITGEWIGAYCLTEPDCGSDPLSARATATLSADGRYYLLNGVKQFITNASFANLFTVFAKIDGRLFSAFLIERETPGLSIGTEEQKMGLKGTSTAQVILENVRIPVGNLLGEAGKGHKIAFNVLNIGRLKLAASVTGAAKGAFTEAAGYATERKQFGQKLASFGAIREKLANMAGSLFAAESLLYRVAGLLDQRIGALEAGSADYYEHYQKAIEEYAGECAIAKVFCTNTLAQVADEALQIHGGYGYINGYPVERYYRDERINRIFEGTNEINRLLIPTLLFRRYENKTSSLWKQVEAAKAENGDNKNKEAGRNKLFDPEYSLLANQKQLFLVLLGALHDGLGEQEILLAQGDMLIAIFALESSILRADKIMSKVTAEKQALLQSVVRVVAFETAASFQQAANRCAAYGSSDEELPNLQQTIARLGSCPAAGLLAAKRLLADASAEAGAYPF